MVTDDDENSDGEVNRSLAVARSPSQNDLADVMECPVCFDLLLPPIRICFQGHNLCSNCASRLSTCPLCLQPIGNGRNFFMEDFLNKSTLMCKYNEDGCDAELPGTKIKKHLKECHFRPLRCHYCQKKVPFSNMDGHLLVKHNVSKWDLNDQGMRIVKVEKIRQENPNPYIVISRTTAVVKFVFFTFALSILLDSLYSSPEEEPWLITYYLF